MRLTAFGETKILADWVRDPRCTVTRAATVLRRLRAGLSPEGAMRAELRIIQGPLYRAFGEWKGLYQWAKDRRSVVNLKTVVGRVHAGMNVEEAILTPVDKSATVRNAARKFEALGERKTLPQWSEDTRCQVALNTLRKRISLGWKLESALTKSKRVRLDRRKLVAAFGETKSMDEWVDDPRCVVDKIVLGSRLTAGLQPERAITAPKGYGHQTYEAFGERKLLMDWSRDPRCVVTFQALYKRIHAGMDLVEAMITPMKRPFSPHKVWGTLTAFGETKTVYAWSEDERCVVSEITLKKRIAAGIDPEEAMSTPGRTSLYGMFDPRYYGPGEQEKPQIPEKAL